LGEDLIFEIRKRTIRKGEMEYGKKLIKRMAGRNTYV
jgi:hypothetical protein